MTSISDVTTPMDAVRIFREICFNLPEGFRKIELIYRRFCFWLQAHPNSFSNRVSVELELRPLRVGDHSFDFCGYGETLEAALLDLESDIRESEERDKANRLEAP